MEIKNIPRFGDVPTWVVGDVTYVYYAPGRALYTYDPVTERSVLYQPNVKSIEDAETFIA